METRAETSEKKRETKPTGVVMDAFTCPITLEPFVEPVVAQDGHTYEKAAIQKWLEKNNTSPLTLKPLPTRKLLINWAIKKAIDEAKTLNEENLAKINALEKQAEEHIKTISDLKQKNQELEKVEKQPQIDTPQPNRGSFLDFFSKPDVCSGEKKETSHCCIL